MRKQRIKWFLWPTIETPLTSRLRFSVASFGFTVKLWTIFLSIRQYRTYIIHLYWSETATNNRHHANNNLQIKIQALSSLTLTLWVAFCVHHLVVFIVFSIKIDLFSLFCFHVFVGDTNSSSKRFPSIEQFRMGLLLSFRCSLTAFIIRFSFSVSFSRSLCHAICLCFILPSHQPKLTDWLADWLADWSECWVCSMNLMWYVRTFVITRTDSNENQSELI